MNTQNSKFMAFFEHEYAQQTINAATEKNMIKDGIAKITNSAVTAIK